ncbi:2-hydroxymuconate tautomerase [Kerstersia gyiorum]|jgi:4-oxalocrotonate tautomerase|uniref:Tautomerase n=1 Tax=Kerstersia gyiorum TaxID=206506 RepID=A0A171KTZ9_9BURK|nr:2-hydroxymuconate tautomerase [Kerstersia gyiorum]AZV93485.1 4-oxalocrotonate tautomerase [Bordetella sp. J329]KKO72366.1 4-oxalocrotonate tautomerase [Kerstersia gyiorum]MCH4273117.1 2-hydroxymuconate tautomerase family protein [Kerstersia gyiorum]MCI1228474.1 2-hydroxymuconate tautomerase family protein [Kerstersia gyiorum]MCP1632860.1 4-oxalocrotonate tautomerase [Kerstersia gyiorum]
MPIIQVSLIQGRSEDQKAALIQALTDAAENSIGAPRDSVRVILLEVPNTDFGMGGRTAKSLGR